MASSEPGKRANPALYGGMPPARGPAGMSPRLLEFADELRTEGVAVGTSELLDAFQALDAVSWTSQEDFREALAATLAKSQEDRRVLDVLFDRFFFRAVERELEIVQLHAPELDQKVARKLVEVIHMVRALDLKKPPSIAESIDWARALLLLGAEDVDQAVLQKTMSIIVKHRTDLDLVAERVGVKLGDGLLGTRQAG